MTRDVKPPGGNLQIRSEQATAGIPSGKRLGAILGVSSLLLICASVGGWFYRAWAYPPPEIPIVNLDGADPEIAQAVQIARQAVQRAPRSAAAWGNLAKVLQAHTIDGPADSCYAVAGELDPRNPTWPYLQGMLHHDATGGPERALPCFERAARLSPPNSMARLRLAGILLELGRVDDSNQEYLTALSADPESAYALLGLATIAATRQQYRDALTYLKSIHDNALVQKRAAALLASVYEQLGDRPAAQRERQRLAELPNDQLRPDDPINQVASLWVGIKARLAKANALREQDQVDERLAVLREAAAIHPESDEVWGILGIELQSVNDYSGAERSFKKSIALAPKNASHRFQLGMLQLSQQQFREGEASFRKALELRPTYYQASFGLGKCLQGLGNRAGAAQAYRSALRYAPDFEPARESLKKLDEQP